MTKRGVASSLGHQPPPRTWGSGAKGQDKNTKRLMDLGTSQFFLSGLGMGLPITTKMESGYGYGLIDPGVFFFTVLQIRKDCRLLGQRKQLFAFVIQF